MCYRAADYDVICLEAVVLPGGKTMVCLYGNGRKFASFSLTSPSLVIEHLQPLIMEALCDYCVFIFVLS